MKSIVVLVVLGGATALPSKGVQAAAPRIPAAVYPPGATRNYFQEVRAMQIPKDVQEGIREIYGEDELLRQIAEVDQLDAKLRDDIEADRAEMERRRRQ